MFFINDDGIRLSAVLEQPEEKTTSLVVILHGFTSTKDRPHNIQAAEAMRDAGYATLRFDLYGHGESGGEFRKHTLYKWISNTMTVIDWAGDNGFENILGYKFNPDIIPDAIGTIKDLALDGSYIRVAQTIHVEDAFRFAGPALILHGDKDDTVPLEDSGKAAEQYENCELKVIAGETHHFDQHPEQMKRIIREWMERRK